MEEATGPGRKKHDLERNRMYLSLLPKTPRTSGRTPWS